MIVWSEADNYDLALSFQEKAGCDEIWEKICQVKSVPFYQSFVHCFKTFVYCGVQPQEWYRFAGAEIELIIPQMARESTLILLR